MLLLFLWGFKIYFFGIFLLPVLLVYLESQIKNLNCCLDNSEN